MSNSDFPGIMALSSRMKSLTKQALHEYTPVVNSIINDKSREKKQIEHTLDGILNFCFEDNMLMLYKKLCRYYYNIDPQATAEYVNAYRDIWDSEIEGND